MLLSCVGRLSFGDLGMAISVFNIKNNTIQVLSNMSSAYEMEFMDAIEGIVESGFTQVILDFSAIHYISSTTIGLIVAASAKATENNAKVKLIASQSIRNILTTCGIASMLDIAPA